MYRLVFLSIVEREIMLLSAKAAVDLAYGAEVCNCARISVAKVQNVACMLNRPYDENWRLSGDT